MKTKTLVIVLALCAVGVIGLFIYLSHSYISCDGDKKYSTVFDDMQGKHITVAKKKAFTGAPLLDATTLKPQVQGLLRIKSNRFLKVGHLTHSLPYLTEESAYELNQIAKDFQAKVRQRHLPYCRILVTSLLRTTEDVKHLQEINKNATKDSPHMYGTTFDIAWAYYQCPKRSANGDEYFKILADVLKEHRDAQKIYVRYETRERCFHITVR